MTLRVFQRSPLLGAPTYLLYVVALSYVNTFIVSLDIMLTFVFNHITNYLTQIVPFCF